MNLFSKTTSIICLLFVLLFMVGCATSGQGVGQQVLIASATPVFSAGTPTPLNGGAAYLNAQATMEFYEFEATQTASAQYATVQSQQATAVAQQTWVAIVAQTATQESIYTTATVVAGATQVSAQMTLEVHAVNLQLTRTQSDMQARLDEALIGAEMTRTYQESQQSQLSLERQRTWNSWLPVFYVLVAFVFVVVVCGLAVIAGRMLYLRLNPVVVIQASEQPVLVRPGYQVLPGRVIHKTPALPAPAAAPKQITVAPSSADNFQPIRTPRWEGFIKYIVGGDKGQIPIGLTSNGPIFVNPVTQPHGMLVGVTGAGKSSSGLIPIIVGMANRGVHVIAVNGRGNDFNVIRDRANITVAPTVPGRVVPFQVAPLVAELVAESERRDAVLERYNYSSWQALPVEYRTGPEIVLVIDEFFDIIDTVKEMIKNPAGDPEEKAELRGVIYELWGNLKTIVKKNRKHGIYLIITVTDCTAEAMSGDGMELRRQMYRMIFRMNDVASSRAILGNTGEYKNGSIGLPTGHFLFTTGGSVQMASGFRPSSADIDQLYNEARPVVTYLPEQILEAVNNRGVRPINIMPQMSSPTIASDEEARGMARAEINGRSLDDFAKENTVFSLNKIALELSDGNQTGKASGLEYEYAVEAVAWRVKNLNCSWATEVAHRATGQYGSKLKELVGEFVSI